MQVILLEKIRNLGNLGDKVQVKPGYARNFLVPYDKAVFATRANIAEFEVRKAELEKAAAEVLAAAEKRATGINALAALALTVQASEEGKLFGSIGLREISDAVIAAGIEVNKNEISMPEGPIHEVGEYEVDVLLHTDVVAKVQVVVTAED
jgi:large subunit ribosomal protein L9